MKIGFVVPHIFMQDSVLPQVIFSPGSLALQLTERMQELGVDVTLYTPGPVKTSANNITADLTYFEQELLTRETDYIGLLKSHPLTFITLSRQLQSEIIAKAYADANNSLVDVVHVYTNEEDIALPFAQFCNKQVVFTHHDPFNLTANYQNVFPKYRHLNWLSVSMDQRLTMPDDTNWVGNIYHGLDETSFSVNLKPKGDYLAYMGRIISSKGVHLAILAVKLYNQTAKQKLKLKIAGKHYSETANDSYWNKHVLPELDGDIEYVGFIKEDHAKQEFLGNALGLIIPSTFEEPFGMVMIEALACGTPLLGLDSGAIPEIITPDCGVVVTKVFDVMENHKRPRLNESETHSNIANEIPKLLRISRAKARKRFEDSFNLEIMAKAHIATYNKLILQR